LAKVLYPTIGNLSRSDRDQMNRRLKRLIRKRQVDLIISTLVSEWDIPTEEAKKYTSTLCKNNKARDLTDKRSSSPPNLSKNKKSDLMQITADRGGTLQEVMEIGIRRGMTRNAAIEKARRLLGEKQKTPYVQFVQGGAPK